VAHPGWRLCPRHQDPTRLVDRNGSGSKHDCEPVLLDRDAFDHLIDDPPVLDTVAIGAVAAIATPAARLIAVVPPARTSACASGPAGVGICCGRHSVSAIVRKKVRQSIENGQPYIGGRNAGDGPSFALAPFGYSSRDVVCDSAPHASVRSVRRQMI
jgi:hypothetical protein